MKNADECVLALPGLEADNLLAFLALLGLLRSLEAARPGWRPRASWWAPPWQPRLHLAHESRESEVGEAAAEGVLEIAGQFDCDGRDDVKFMRDDFRAFAARVADNPVAAALASAITAELPLKEDGTAYAGPLVLMFGQGHQHF